MSSQASPAVTAGGTARAARRWSLLSAGLALVGLAAARRATAQGMPGMGPMEHAAAPASAFVARMGAAMNRMDRAMAAAPMNGDPTHDFMSMMIPHHQGAIDMAKLYLAVGKDPHVRNLAEEIIATQGNEIQIMRHWLTTLPRARAAVLPPDATHVSGRHGQ
jgi:uncharacterized protein (DUF305 family)